jgi:outer membrane lipoprotein LolB
VSSLRVSAAALLLSALLAACATPPVAPALDSLNGRLALRVQAHEGTPARSFAAPFELQGNARVGQFSLFTPLGTTAARADWRPGHAVLSNENGQSAYPDLDSLAADMLGQALPMAALLDWLRGRPWAGAPHTATEAGFEQLGWQIDTRARAEGRVEARRAALPVVTVSIRLESAAP